MRNLLQSAGRISVKCENLGVRSTVAVPAPTKKWVGGLALIALTARTLGVIVTTHVSSNSTSSILSFETLKVTYSKSF